MAQRTKIPTVALNSYDTPTISARKWTPAMVKVLRRMAENGACERLKVARRYATPEEAWQRITFWMQMDALTFLDPKDGWKVEDLLYRYNLNKLPHRIAARIVATIIPNPLKLPTTEQVTARLETLVRLGVLTKSF